MKTIRIRYLGTKLPKIVELPIPYVSKSERTGQVICDPIGEFPAEDGERLLAMAGADAMFVLEPDEMEYGDPCLCGCGEPTIIRPYHKKTNSRPKFIFGHHLGRKGETELSAVSEPQKAELTDRPGE